MLAAFREFWQFAMQRKKFWLIPLILTFMALGILIVATQGSTVAPFIYALF